MMYPGTTQEFGGHFPLQAKGSSNLSKSNPDQSFSVAVFGNRAVKVI